MNGVTGLTYSSLGLRAYYMREGDTSPTSITLANISNLGTYVSGGFREVGSHSMPGVYEFDPPNAALSSGADRVIIELSGASGMVPCILNIELVDYVEKDSYHELTNPTYGLSAINSDTDAIKSQTDKMQFTLSSDIKATLDGEKVVLTDDTEAQIDAIEADTNEIQTKLPANNKMGSSVKSDKDEEIDAIKAETDKIQTIDDNVDAIKVKTDKLQFNLENDVKATLDGEKVVLTDTTEAQIDAIEADTNEIQGKLPTGNIMGSSTKSNMDDEINAIKSKTDNLPSDPADQSLVEDAIKTSENNIRGADNDTLKTLSDQLDTAQADLDNPDQYKADVSGLALETTAQEILEDTNEIQTKLPTNNIMGSSVKTDKDDEIDAIKDKTDKLTFSADSNIQARVADKGVLNDPSVEDIDNKLSTEHGNGSWEGGEASSPKEIAKKVWTYYYRTLTEKRKEVGRVGRSKDDYVTK